MPVLPKHFGRRMLSAAEKHFWTEAFDPTYSLKMIPAE